MNLKKSVELLPIAGLMSTTGVITDCLANESSSKKISLCEEQVVSYDVFQHTISESISIERNQVNQIDGHLGYQPCAITFADYGKHFCDIGGGCIFFTNYQNIVSKDNEFGKPILPEPSLNHGEFLPYQHILLVPSDIASNFNQTITYPYHEGYQLVGADSLTYGQYLCDQAETYLLYANIEPVKCLNYVVRNGKIIAAEFGVPIKNNKVFKKRTLE